MMQPSATRLSEAERELDYIESLLPSQRNENQQSWLDNYKAFLSKAKEEDPLCNLDDVPPPFQFPPGASKSEEELPDEYMYYPETHLNWNVVYTVNKTTMEIVGVCDTVKCDLIAPAIAQCRDGTCKRKRCDPKKYIELVLESADCRRSVSKLESERISSFKGYGALARLTEDDYGYMVDFNGKMPVDESELDSSKIYHRQMSMSTCSPAV